MRKVKRVIPLIVCVVFLLVVVPMIREDGELELDGCAEGRRGAVEAQVPTVDTSAVDEVLETVVASGHYAEADGDTRRAIVAVELELLHDAGRITAPARYHEGSDMFTFEYAGGVLGGFSFREPGAGRYNGGASGIPEAARCSTVTGEEAVCAIYYGLDAGNADDYRQLAREWTGQGVPTHVQEGVTVEDLRTLESCPVLVLSMHGGVYGETPTLVPGEHPNTVRDAVYSRELVQQQSVVKVTYESGNRYYEILPRFFSYAYAEDFLEGTVVFSESCEFYGGESTTGERVDYFADALIHGIGAEAVLGYFNKVGTAYSRRMLEVMVEDVVLNMKTPKKAAQRAIDKFGEDDGIEVAAKDKYPAYLCLNEKEGDRVLFGKRAGATPSPTAAATAAPEAAYADAREAYHALLTSGRWGACTASEAEGMDPVEYARGALGSWTLWDMDLDGTQELILSSGWAQANFCITVFTYKEGKLWCLGSEYCGSGFAFGEPQRSGLVIKSYHGGGSVHTLLDIVDGRLCAVDRREYTQEDGNHVHHLTAGGAWNELEARSLDDAGDLEG